MVVCETGTAVKVKDQVYRRAVTHAMMYSSETLSTRQEDGLEVAELKMLKFLLGVTRMDRIIDLEIRLERQG